MAIGWAQRRWRARGGAADDVLDVALWAAPFGIVGGLSKHVITDPEFYFAPGQDPSGRSTSGVRSRGVRSRGAWIGCRRRGIRLADVADAVAPGMALARAIGRW